MTSDIFDNLLDASGQPCPMPLLKTKQAINKMEVGKRLKVISTDKGSLRDIPSYISLTNHELLGLEENIEDGVFIYYILKR